MNTIKKINKLIDELRPYLVNDGGDIEFIKFEDKDEIEFFNNLDFIVDYNSILW